MPLRTRLSRRKSNRPNPVSRVTGRFGRRRRAGGRLNLALVANLTDTGITDSGVVTLTAAKQGRIVRCAILPRVMSHRSLLNSLRRFSRLPPAKRLFAVETALTLLLAWLLVRFVPARHWFRFLDTAPEPGTPPHREAGAVNRRTPDARVPRKVGRALGKVVRHLPFRARCLPQAMAAQWILRRRGVPSKLFFGVRRSTEEQGSLEFHAWLTAGGECVVGGHEVESFTVFPPFGAAGGDQ